jgi:POT family proton-dependent oligopeptide transporter
MPSSFRQRYNEIMPTGAGALFLMQLFSIMSYSVLYSTLILYTTKSLHMSDELATIITGLFLALNNFLHLLGGYIGGRFFSYRSLFVISMLMEILGCALIAIPETSFLLWGLAAFLTGCGINLTCIYCLLTQLFQPDDKNRETSFLWNYSGLNIGFFIGFLIAGHFELQQAYQQLFMLSALGNIIALAITLYKWKLLSDHDTRFTGLNSAQRSRFRLLGIGIILVLIIVLKLLLQNPEWCTRLIIYITVLVFAWILFLAARQRDKINRQKITAYCILAMGAIIFWTLLLIGPLGLNLFTERNVDRHFLGTLLAPQWILNMNNLMTVVFAPIISILFTRARARGFNISLPLQFAAGLIIMGSAYAILPFGISKADIAGYTDVNWVIVSYTLQSIGDLFVSPVGYALVGQLAPPRLRGIMMGTWMMFGGVTGVLADYFSRMAEGNTNSPVALVTNASYSHTFGMVGWGTICAGLLLLVCTPLVTRLTQERKKLAFSR